MGGYLRQPGCPVLASETKTPRSMPRKVFVVKGLTVESYFIMIIFSAAPKLPAVNSQKCTPLDTSL